MKQKLLIGLALIFLLITLIGLNAASYTQKEKVPDSEELPNRSTYNTGATGTRAFYDLLGETGHRVTRFQEEFPKDGVFDPEKFSTFVIIGQTRRTIKDEEVGHILEWVSTGGTLVVIDRNPPDNLISTASYWYVSTIDSDKTPFQTDPSKQKDMVGEAVAAKPILPTIFTNDVNAVQPSQFATSIKTARLFGSESENKDDDVSDESDMQAESPTISTEKKEGQGIGTGSGNDRGSGIGSGDNNKEGIFTTPKPTPIKPIMTLLPIDVDENEDESLIAPVVHIANEDKNLLVDYPFGAGQVIYLTDPYIVANGGIKLVDNAQLGINIVASNGGIIAFDEYHQGYGNNQNRLLEYFSGTPLIAILLQVFLVIGLIFYSQSRRFARALPADEPNRLSKLEYVSAMAELQGRTKAFDLAIENIYKEFRRRVSRLLGIDNHTATREDIADKIAERTDYKSDEISDLLFKCEDIMHGEPTKKKEIVNLIRQLREVEESLGLRRSKKRGTKK